ncbi:MAG: MFS transporter [Gammaproteobacteria bacterium]|nr:MFS transporter [Gammaproteobacteria bacterium]
MQKGHYNRRTSQIYFFGALGSIVEWYDFAIYGYLASIFAQTFFINKNHWLAIVLVYAIFFISYLVRPLGALIYGYIGDHFGRRQALILSVAMMSVTMLIMACLPTWYAIGALAPLFLLTFRIFQGISVGGETTGALVYILESVNQKRYGLYGSITGTIPVIGIFLGSSIVALLSSTLSTQALLNWGWRLAYLIGFLLGCFIFIMRIFMPESTAFQQLKQSSMEIVTPHSSPFKKALREYIGLWINNAYLINHTHRKKLKKLH